MVLRGPGALRPALAVLLVVAFSCAGQSPSSRATQVVSNHHVFLRNSFDKDPSSYIGRFVTRGDSDLDETAAMQLVCSKHIGYSFVEGGGVEYTETMAVSSEAAAKIGIPMVAGVDASGARSTTARVQYTLTGKLVGNIEDPEAFAACCKAAPDQCTDRYIGEFLQGTGTVFQSSTARVDAGAQGRTPQGVEGVGSVSHDESLHRAVVFSEPVYFAFKLTRTPYARVTSACGRWVDTPPSQPGYVFFVGSSRPLRSEAAARTWAKQRAIQAAYVSAGGTEIDIETELDATDPAMLWAQRMRVVETCVETVSTDRGPKYIGRVLGKLPEFGAESG